MMIMYCVVSSVAFVSISLWFPKAKRPRVMERGGPGLTKGRALALRRPTAQL